MESAVSVVNTPQQAGAMLDPVRVRMLQELAEPDTAAGVARRIGIPRQRANYHLRELEKAKLVEFVEQRRRGNCMERVVRATATYYVIDPTVVGGLAADPKRIADKFSASYLVAVASQMIREIATLMSRARRAKKGLPTFTLQTEVRFATADKVGEFTEELTNTVSKLVAKYHEPDASRGRLFRYVLGAYPAITKPADKE